MFISFKSYLISIFIFLFIISNFVYSKEMDASEQQHDHEHHEISSQNGTDQNKNLKSKKSHSSHFHSVSPAGLMLPHFQNDQGWMAEYMYMGMDMNKIFVGDEVKNPYEVLYGTNYNTSVGLGNGHNHGTSNGSLDPFPNFTPQILSSNSYRYMSAPISMFMEMHMMNVMKTFKQNFSLCFLVPYLVNSMDMLSSDLEKTSMKIKGVGDISMLMDYQLFKNQWNRFYFRLGLNLPSGSIEEKSYMPMMGYVKVPYNMQLGSGSFSAISGLGYNLSIQKFSFGFNSQGLFRLGKNKNDYQFGNRYEASSWIAYSLLPFFKPSFRASYYYWENIKGKDSEINPQMDPQNDPNHQGGRRIDCYLGFQTQLPFFSNFNFGIEIGKPIYQHLNGPQLATGMIYNIKAQAMF